MSRLRRVLACALLVVAVLALSAGPAFAHAVLLGSTPSQNGRGVPESAKTVVLRFSEGVEVLNRSDVTVVNARGRRVDTGAAHTASGDPRQVIIPMRGPLLPESYTVRYRVVSADSHSSVQAFVFGVGKAKLRPPILAGTGGLTDTSAAVVAARVVEFAALMLLVGLLAFRMLVWGPAVEIAAGLDAAGRDEARRRGQRLFWRAFWALAALTGLAESGVLVAKSAVVFHTSLTAAALHPADAYHLIAASRFGDFLGWRCGALFALVAVAFVVWTLESTRPPSSGRRGQLAAIGALGIGALTLLAGQGHASQAPLAPLEIAFDATHLTAVSIWMCGLLCLAVVLLRAPRALPEGGRALASATLARFSKVALWSIVVIGVTGVVRATGELSSPLQLMTTGYGRSLMLKASLLAPILVLARRNRRVIGAFAGGLKPTPARLRAIARTVQVELAMAMAILVVAAILVAQVPGRG
jgi:copper transport protein